MKQGCVRILTHPLFFLFCRDAMLASKKHVNACLKYVIFVSKKYVIFVSKKYAIFASKKKTQTLEIIDANIASLH